MKLYDIKERKKEEKRKKSLWKMRKRKE